MIRIASAGFLHESNTFSAIPASLDLWQRSGILDGDAIRREYAQSQSTLAGFLALEQEDPQVQVVPLVFSRLTPMGAITPDAIEHLFQRIIDAIRDNGPWDGVLLPQHGAAVSEPYLDPDGELLRRVRELVGPDVPIGMALDMHANVSPAMVEPADIVTVYQTNPHIDARAQALLCARLLVQTIRGTIRPRMALATPPLVVNILCQGTNDQPMSELLAAADIQRRRPGVLSVSVVEGYPYADVPEMGMSFIAVTDNDQALADESVEPRLNQVTMALKTIVDSDEMRADIDTFIRAYNENLIADRQMTLPALIVQALAETHFNKRTNVLGEDARDFTLKGLADTAQKIVAELDPDTRVTAKRVATILSEELGMPRRGVCNRTRRAVVLYEEPELKALMARYGIQPPAQEAQ